MPRPHLQRAATVRREKVQLPICVKIVRYQEFTNSKRHNQTQKRKEKKRKEIKKKEEDVEDELANQFNDTMNIST
jgi:hypothetical protein